ncbi:delta-12 fatty acid desaturase [Lobosporangium transversale]|uniref:Delta-12 fatty acid desaturase n=1 Tax=Lobosporangium transversale TaxID=64571 RepID=A0A1Y2H0C9_9FUNG|nr:delta-12 fatty acid desaturase [Lobosporangium transversale]ORZ26522.1 delta-12 fatty acid desaturase [Lobosporangium transversale]|eukprot:XP_021884287.1 delta-12 fatty acid desaturase [Lobosporangium transversale]
MLSNTTDATGLHQRVVSNTSPAPSKAAFERNYKVPEFTIKEIRDCIPAHCFERSGLRGLTHVAIDLIYLSLLFLAATQIDKVQNPLIRYLAWPVYWVLQGIVGTGIWILAHECGHQSFSTSKTLNNTVGWILHSALLVPYHSWRISHSKHHKATGHMTKDQVFVPKTRKQVGLPPLEHSETEEEAYGEHLDEEAPIVTLFWMLIYVLFGWPAYLFGNAKGQDYGRWTSHFHTWSPIFEARDFSDVILSDFGVLLTLGALVYASFQTSFLTVVKYYGIPYLFVNFWLIIITFLQHTDTKVPHYREGAWNFQRGALCTVDRSFGKFLDHMFHGIAHTHVAHHLFSQMPFYHAEEATYHLKKLLGEYYIYDDTPIAIACWRSFRECRFVEDEGDVVFFKK